MHHGFAGLGGPEVRPGQRGVFVAAGVAEGKGVVEDGRFTEVEGTSSGVVAAVGVEKVDNIRNLEGVSSWTSGGHLEGTAHRKDNIAQEENVVEVGPVLSKLQQRL